MKKQIKLNKEENDPRLLLTSDVAFYISLDDEREVLQTMDYLPSTESNYSFDNEQ